LQHGGQYGGRRQGIRFQPAGFIAVDDLTGSDKGDKNANECQRNTESE
jgi:hypothetical protein